MDEVLAVGDVTFQQKCLDKMHEIRSQGRTILFVSHNMAAVTRLCERAILLDKGQMLADGPTSEVVTEYLGSSWQVSSERYWSPLEAPGNHVVKFRSVRVRTSEGLSRNTFDVHNKVGIELTYEVFESGHILTPKIDLLNEEGAHLFSSHDVGRQWRREPRAAGQYVSTIWIPENFLSEGNLLVHAAVMSHSPATLMHVHVPKAIGFQVVDSDVENTARGDYIGPIPGMIRPLLTWTTDFCSH